MENNINIEENINLLIKEFNKIKNKDLNKSIRNNKTSIGYTFECLINKKEDNKPLPDFNNIEIKTKLGYSLSPMTLFTLTPQSNKEHTMKEILNKYGYPNKNNKEYKSFKGDIFHNYKNTLSNKYIFKTKLCINENKLKLIILDTSLNIIDDTIYWNLNELKERLLTKLSYLALIKGYNYKRNNELYYKYTNLYLYKLKDFDTFIKLIQKDIIYITINLDTFTKGTRIGQVHDRGTAFRINVHNIKYLFDIIN